MSEKFFVEAYVSYPDREEAVAFFPPTHSPFSRFEVGATLPIEDYHIRRNGSQTFTVLDYTIYGTGELTIGDETFEIKAGDVMVLREGEEHFFRALPGKPWQKIWIKYSSEYILPFLNAYGVKSGIYHAENARPYFERLWDMRHSKLSQSEMAYSIAECVNKIIYLAAASLTPEAESDEVRIREALNASVYDKMDLDALVESLHMSKSNIIRKYKKRYGVTPYEYLLALKMENAKMMLKSTKMTVKEISERLAITDEHYFSSLFYRRVGMRPLVYRKSYNEV